MFILRLVAFAFALTCVAALAAADGCNPTGTIIAGTINRGGYQFEYESREGVNCREYRIRNKPGQPLTPVKWAFDDTVFIDANLPACRKTEVCAWTTAVQRSVERNKLPTQIGFGINKDEFTEKPVALVEARQIAAVPTTGTPYATMSGVFTDASGKPATIDFSFHTSQSGDRWLVDYTASQQPTWRGSKYPVIIRWGTDTETFYVSHVEPGEARIARFALAHVNENCADNPRESVITATQGGRIIAQTSAPAPCRKPL